MKIQHLKKNLNHHITEIFFRNNVYSLIKNRNEKLNNFIVNEKSFFISKTVLPFIEKSCITSLKLVTFNTFDTLYYYYNKNKKDKVLIHILKLKNFLIKGVKIFKIFLFLDFIFLIKLKFFFSNILLRCKIFYLLKTN